MPNEKYLEQLAGLCSHLSSFGNLEYNCIRSFSREDLHIQIIHDFEVNYGKVKWKNKEVFSFIEGYNEEWFGEEPSEDMSEDYKGGEFVEMPFFRYDKYIPGIWEGKVGEFYKESMEEDVLI